MAAEVFIKYGHHPSFYGFYYTPEMFATFAYDGCDKDLLRYVTEMEKFSFDLDPLLFSMLAVNTQGLENYIDKWVPILQHLDIVTPFYFPVPNQVLYVPIWKNLSETYDFQAWIDIEMFERPINSSGLIPRDLDDLLQEMDYYDVLPNLTGYEFTGLMDNPNSRLHLGGLPAAKSYQRYQQYYNHRIKLK